MIYHDKKVVNDYNKEGRTGGTMSLRYQLARRAGQFTKWSLRKLKRNATSFPGKVSLTIDPNFLANLSKDIKIVMVTGTNGKTLTTSLITHVLKEKYKVLTNESGSNMIQGITSTLLNIKNEDIIVLEVDEANLKKITPVLKPEIIVFTNVFRDQMDRFGEIYTTYQYMVDGAKHAPDAIIIANGDTPLFNYDDLNHRKLFFGFNHQEKEPITPSPNTDGLLCPQCHNILNYDLLTYSNLGNYHCSDCGFKRPELHYEVTKINQLHRNWSQFDINHHPFKIEVGGLYNIYNALAAYSVGIHFGLTPKEIQTGFKNTPMKFGRQEEFKLNDKTIVLNLVKNPVGFNQIVDLIELDKQEKSLVCLLNDKHADGIDVSWIWDADYEKLNTLNIKETIVGGFRKEDLKQRLEVAGFKHLIVNDSIEQLTHQIKQLPTSTIYILATYTALLQLREHLSKSDLVSMEMK